jgi:hypothetical protein
MTSGPCTHIDKKLDKFWVDDDEVWDGLLQVHSRSGANMSRMASYSKTSTSGLCILTPFACDLHSWEIVRTLCFR